MCRRKVLTVLMLAGVWSGLWACAPGAVDALNTAPAVLASQSPMTTSLVKTATARPKPSPVIPRVSSPIPTEPGIDVTQAQEILPLQPSSVLAVSRLGEIRIEWPGTGESLLYYEVFRRISTSEDWSALEQIKVSGDNLARFHYTDQMVDPGVEYIYAIAAVNTLGTSSLITESDPIKAK